MRAVLRVQLCGLLARLAGHCQARVKVSAQTTVYDLLTALAEQYGPAFAAAVFCPSGAVQARLRVFLDGQEVTADDCLLRQGQVPKQVLVRLLAAAVKDGQAARSAHRPLKASVEEPR